MWTTPQSPVDNQPTTPANPSIQAKHDHPKPDRDNPLGDDHHDGMTPAEALQLVARWATELRAENAGLRRENEWHTQTISRQRQRIKQLERLHKIADDRLYRFWMERFAPTEVDDLAHELEAVA